MKHFEMFYGTKTYIVY